MASSSSSSVHGTLAVVPEGKKIRKCTGYYCGCVECIHKVTSKWVDGQTQYDLLKMCIESEQEYMAPEVKSDLIKLVKDVKRHLLNILLSDSRFVDMSDEEKKAPIMNGAEAEQYWVMRSEVPVGYHLHVIGKSTRLELNTTKCTSPNCTLRSYEIVLS